MQRGCVLTSIIFNRIQFKYPKYQYFFHGMEDERHHGGTRHLKFNANIIDNI